MVNNYHKKGFKYVFIRKDQKMPKYGKISQPLCDQVYLEKLVEDFIGFINNLTSYG